MFTGVTSHPSHIVLVSTLQWLWDNRSAWGAHIALALREEETASFPKWQKMHIWLFFTQQIPPVIQPLRKEWQRCVGDSSKVTHPSTDLGITAEKMAMMVSQLSQNSSLSTSWVSSGTLLFSLRSHTRMAETRWALCCLSLSFQSPAGLSGHQAASPTALVHTWWKKGL